MLPESRNPPCVGDQVWSAVELLVTATASPHRIPTARGENWYGADGSVWSIMLSFAVMPVAGQGEGDGWRVGDTFDEVVVRTADGEYVAGRVVTARTGVVLADG
jgi:hypothetical protein